MRKFPLSRFGTRKCDEAHRYRDRSSVSQSCYDCKAQSRRPPIAHWLAEYHSRRWASAVVAHLFAFLHAGLSRQNTKRVLIVKCFHRGVPCDMKSASLKTVCVPRRVRKCRPLPRSHRIAKQQNVTSRDCAQETHRPAARQ